MKIILIVLALITTQSAQTWAKCGNLCDPDWWKTANRSDEKAKLDAGADVMARNENGSTPLHSAAEFGAKSGVIEALLEAGSDPKAKKDNGEAPLDLAKRNDALKRH